MKPASSGLMRRRRYSRWCKKGDVICRIHIMRSRLYSLVLLALDMPHFWLMIGSLGRKINISNLEYDLDANILEFFLQIHKDDVFISTLLVEPVKSPFFRWSERTRFTLNHGFPSEHQMYALILLSRSFEIDQCRVEKREERIYQHFNSMIRY